MSYSRNWLEDQGSEDSHGRTLWALGTLVNRSQMRGRRDVAKHYFELAMPAMREMQSLRTWTYGVIACKEYLDAFPDDASVLELIETLSSRMWRQYEINQSDDWPWFEQSLTYANARLPQALIMAGTVLKNTRMVEAGIESLAWLMNVQKGPYGVFAPIGSDGFYRRNHVRSYFDQQPIEAWCSVSACMTAYKATNDSNWLSEGNRAFRWFTGENMLGLPVYDSTTGGCGDGMHAHRVNRNQGAESTISFLCALTEHQSATLRPVSAPIHELK